jgi:hypothetical protein
MTIIITQIKLFIKGFSKTGVGAMIKLMDFRIIFYLVIAGVSATQPGGGAISARICRARL